MAKKSKPRLLLFMIPLLVNILIIAGGLALAPIQAQTGIFGIAAGRAENPTPPPAEEGIEESTKEEEQVSAPPKSAFIITPTVHLKARAFQPSAVNALDSQALQQFADAGQDRVHVLVQLDFIPRQTAKIELAARGLKLLAYVPDYAWIASVSTSDPDASLALPGVAWMGELRVDDKLDPAIRTNQWGSWNLTSEGLVAVNVVLHKDESFKVGRQLAEEYGAQITGEVISINLLVLEMPQNNIHALAAEDAVQWVEAVAPPLTGANDGIRYQIGVNAVNAAPYNLDGTGIDVLVYDSGQAGDHADFGTRLTHGDADSVSEHSTHVAGTVGGDGSNSAAQGGTSLQWRGMAPAVDLISYGTGYSGSGITFYENVPDIEADFAAAQNVYGADLGTASLGSNIYQYFPSDCWVMGNYGSSSVLIDQIVRGGNPVVGSGDKYITSWAAGNERNNIGSCSNTYSSIAPPAAAKNPIHVGASNTNNNSMTSFSSWGPTDDGRIKPIVTAGGCQSSGDFGIKSTDNFPVDNYTVMCGTSMATPAVGGSLALMLQHYRDVYGTSGNFWPSTAKAILMQSAVDFGNPGPDYQWGYGQVDILAAVDLITRKAFRQESIAQGEIDVFYFIVPNDADPATVSLAWDDYEATLNAYPTLINNLNLELVAPDGTIWRPWVLDPSNPAENATRALDNRNNQEQVQVPTPQAGTWLVRVKGTSVPQGPQDYSLVCEGCSPLDVGVCQVEVSGTALAATTFPETEDFLLEENLAEVALPGGAPTAEVLSAGELWQRSLEDQPRSKTVLKDAKIQTAMTAFETAQQKGLESTVGLFDTLRGEALDLLMDEIGAAQEQLAVLGPTPPETDPISEADELAALEAQQAVESANRTQAFRRFNSQAEGQVSGPILEPQLASPDAPKADRTVGSGCTYATIAAAIAAADAGDRLLIEGGVAFVENILIDRDLTLQGGYNGCASGSTGRTTIDGNATNSVVRITYGLNVTLENLNITNGSTGTEGGGIEFALGTGTGQLNLTHVSIYENIGGWGGGLWAGVNTQIMGTDVVIYNNTATIYGGGLRLYGSHAFLSDTYIYDNIAPSGGGVYATLQNTSAPQLNLLSSADVHDNQALTGDGFGGGVYMSQGTVSVADCSDIFYNDAINGGGSYLITSTITINGSCSEIQLNTASGNGGGVYAQGSSINLDEDAELYDNQAGGSGGGAYLDSSNLYSDKSSVRFNTAGSYGGGIYAANNSVVDMDLGGYSCLGVRCSQLSYNTASSSYGGGIYASNSKVDLRNIFVESNSATLGGGLYAYDDSTVYVYNNLFARNNASSTAGDGIRINSASMTGSGNTLAYNDAGGASTGRAIDLASSNLTLGCSIIWGHASSINDMDENVTYSDIQGGYLGAGNLNMNPLFVASGSFDYHLQNTSPVIDRCVSSVSPDFDNQLRPIVLTNAASPYDMGADEADGVARVGLNGGGCTYATIQQAVNLASAGDTLQVAEGIYFENVDIPTGKDIIVAGGYDNTCNTSTGGVSRLEGSSHSGSTLDISGSTVTLENLEITWGSGIGAGVHATSDASVTLDNTDVFNNHGSSGGGIYVSSNSIVSTSNDSDIRNNTATNYGGGVYVSGQFAGSGTYSDIYQNCASHGGGFYIPGGDASIDASDIYQNQAAATSGQGGGILLTNGGVATLSSTAYVYFLNQAFDGAGIYADNAQVYLNGPRVTFRDNIASHDGGGIYLTNGSELYSQNATIGESTNLSNANEALNGAGIYAITSTVDLDGGFIVNNIASSSGAGLYANNSTLTLTGVQVGGTGDFQANQLGPSGHYGAGLYLTGGTVATLDQSLVSSNIFQTAGYTYGGGAYLSNSSVMTMTGSTIERHLAPSAGDGRGAGLYLNSSTVTLDNSEIISNTAGAVGGGVRMLGTSTLNVLNGSLIADNQALNSDGGGIAGAGNPAIFISNARLQDNAANAYGGAIFINNGTLEVSAAYLNSNQAQRGGAIFQAGSSSSQVDNSLIYNNMVSTNYGAGIRSEGGSFALTHVTFADNTGGAAFSQTSTTSSVTNSIAWDNTYGFLGSFVTAACNIDQGSNAGTNINPQFVTPGVNYHLLGSSPAIDACSTGLATDLDQINRPFGNDYDMGAYEYASGITFTPSHSGTGKPATMVSYAHTLTNTGLRADIFTLSAISSQGWSVTIDPATPVVLNSGQSTTIIVTISIPTGTLIGTEDTTTVTATSNVDPTLSASVTDTTQTVPYYLYLPLAMR